MLKAVASPKRLAEAGFLVFSLIVLSIQFVDPIGQASERKQTPFYVLQSLQGGKPPSLVTDLAVSQSSEGAYLFRESTQSLSLFNPAIKTETIKAKFSAKVFTVGAQGRILFVKDTRLSILDDASNRTSEIQLSSGITSISTLKDGKFLIASGDSLSIFDKSGNPVRTIDISKQFDLRDKEQNNFLNLGKVAAGQSHDVYYATLHSPSPTIRKFSEDGSLLTEFAVEGAAVELQALKADEFLSQRKPGCVGGYSVLRDIANDKTTGHLWVGVNGLSEAGSIREESGVVYEYNQSGEKLGEYALRDSEQGNFITDIKEIGVSYPHLYALTSGGTVHTFDLSLRSNVQPKMAEFQAFAPFSLVEKISSMLSPAVSAQGVCPPAQSYVCSATCPSGSTPQSVNCGAELTSRMSQGEVVISGSCQSGSTVGQNGGCSGTITGCTGGGVQVTYSVTLNCNAAPTPTPPPPTPTPEPTPSDDPPSCEEQSCDQGEVWDTSLCKCRWQGGEIGGGCDRNPGGCWDSPIVVDVLGNGFDLTDAANGVLFDLNNDGNLEQLSWTSAGSDDAWLALDRNRNGRIENGRELFGNYTAQPQSPNPNGFIALRVFDRIGRGGNNDGWIDSQDSVFANLRLWQDLNHNGISEPNELHTLTSLGLSRINLDYRESRRVDQHGNQFRYRGRVRDVQGAQMGRWAWDVFLVRQQ